MGRGPSALVVEHPVELEWEYAGFVGGGATVGHTDLLCCLLEFSLLFLGLTSAGLARPAVRSTIARGSSVSASV